MLFGVSQLWIIFSVSLFPTFLLQEAAELTWPLVQNMKARTRCSLA